MSLDNRPVLLGDTSKNAGKIHEKSILPLNSVEFGFEKQQAGAPALRVRLPSWLSSNETPPLRKKPATRSVPDPI